MPHDANGNRLNVGDRVTIPGTITNLLPTEEYCNCSIELDYPMPPEGGKTSISSFNTKQLLLTPIQSVPDEEVPSGGAD